MKKCLAEFIGTFVLVFSGVGSAVLAGNRIGYLGISLAFGLALLTMVYTIGPVSGCHINPAVTVGLLLSRKIKDKDAATYICAQILGAICAAGLVLLIAQGAANGFDLRGGLAANGYGVHSPGQYSLQSAYIVEFISTLFLVLTVLGSTDVNAPVGFSGIAIGLVLTVAHLVAIPVTNASVNPARSIASAIFSGGWALQQLWLFIVAPVSGAVAAAGVYETIRMRASLLKTAVAEKSLLNEQTDRSAAGSGK